MASTPGSKRPDPARDQKEALNRALANAAPAAIIPTQTSDAASLDTFNGTRAQSAAAAVAAGVALVREDNGLNEPGGGSSNGSDGTQSPGGVDEVAKAQEVAERARENRGDGNGGEQADSPFDFENPALSRLRDEMMGSIGVDEEQSTGPGTAAGRTPPGTSGGATGTNPFTSGVGFDAYSAPGGTITTDDLTLGAVGGGNPLDGDGFFAAQMARVGELGSESSFPSVADGALDAATKAAATPEAQAEAAKKAGVTPPAGTPPATTSPPATGAAALPAATTPPPNSEDDDDVPEPGFFTTLGANGVVAAFKELLTPVPDGTLIGSRSGDQGTDTKAAGTAPAFQGLHEAGIENLETKILPATGATGKKKPGTDQPEPGSDPDLGGPPTPAEMAFRNYLREATNYHGSPGHNEGVTTPTDEPTDIGHASAPDKVGMIGQPVRADDGLSGRRSGNPAILPGDQGDVDPAEESDTGGWTSNSQTEQPEDALSGFGGSGLSIGDARRDADDDEEEDEDDDPDN